MLINMHATPALMEACKSSRIAWRHAPQVYSTMCFYFSRVCHRPDTTFPLQRDKHLPNSYKTRDRKQALPTASLSVLSSPAMSYVTLSTGQVTKSRHWHETNAFQLFCYSFSLRFIKVSSAKIASTSLTSRWQAKMPSVKEQRGVFKRSRLLHRKWFVKTGSGSKGGSQED